MGSGVWVSINILNCDLKRDIRPRRMIDVIFD